jgi:hypothetical protein
MIIGKKLRKTSTIRTTLKRMININQNIFEEKDENNYEDGIFFLNHDLL